MNTHYKYGFITSAGFIFLLLLLAINQIASDFNVYYIYRWLDTPMHFLGGFGVGMVAIGILRAVYTREKIDISSKFWITILMVFIVGILWEAVELYYKVSVIFGGQLVFDTIKDLLMDVFGGILSYICFHRRLR